MRHHMQYRGVGRRLSDRSSIFSVAAGLVLRPRARRFRQARGPAMVILALAAVALGAPAQHNGGPPNPPGGFGSSPNNGPNGGPDRNAPGISSQMQEQQAERRNSDRQKQLVADTEKLFQLAQQLRDEVAKSNKEQLSIPVIKKSEEIEKLAKSVKERMRGF